MALQDLKKAALATLGFTGDSVDSCEMKYYLDNGATTPSLIQAQLEMLAIKGFSTGSLQDRWNAYLSDEGYTGSLQDKLNALWAAGGPTFGGGGASDPYWANVVSLLYLDGTNGSTTFTDQKGKIWTAEGTGAQISSGQTLFGDNTFYTNGGSGRITSPDSADFAFGTGEFTIEFWYRGSLSSVNGVVGQWDNPSSSRAFWCGGTGPAGCYVTVGGSLRSIYGAVSPLDTVWHHYALNRTADDFKVYIDAALVASATYAGTMSDSTSKVEINTLNFPFSGNVSNVRITKGVGRYPAAGFSLPAAKFPNS